MDGLTLRLAAIRRELARMKRHRAYPVSTMQKMIGLHVAICMDAADAVDRFRGRKWVQRFLAVAWTFGYRPDERQDCSCNCRFHHVTCRLVRIPD